MSLLKRLHPKDNITLDLVYARENNFTGKAIYTRYICYLHPDALNLVYYVADLLRPLDLSLKIFDGFRPMEAQWILWNLRPNTGYLADPRKGSSHSRGIAVDVTLVDSKGNELDMGTSYEDFHSHSSHGCQDITPQAQRNRYLLFGVMMMAGWDRNLDHEWWHFQLPNATNYPLMNDYMLKKGIMAL